MTKPNRPVLTGAIALTVLFCGLWLGRIITPVPLQAFYIPAGSMENTLLINDRLLTNLLVYRFRAPRNDEIAIFQAPKSALLDANSSEKVDFVKRVVGTPGDVVTIVDRQLFRNGARVREPYAKWSDHNLGDGGASSRYSYDMKIVDGAVYSREYLVPNEPGPWIKNNALASEKEQRKITSAKPAPVPPDQFLMLGDHRNNSNDSHIWGFAPRRAFVGRAMFVFWPVQHWKNLH